MSDPKEFLSRTGYRRVTATTNADLTGPITSVGNATSISASVNLPGSPTTTTQPLLDNSTKIATTAYVDSAIAATDDFLSGIYYIPPATTKTIPVYKQMIVKDTLILEGNLIVNGQLFMEA